MKQVLINSKDNYIFELPKTYDLFIKEVCNKLKVKKENINLYYNLTSINKNNFKEINKELNIIDFSFKLKGGSGFPSIMKLLAVIVTLTLLLTFILFFTVISILSVINYTVGKKTFLQIFEEINYVPSWNSFSINNHPIEFLFISIIIYIFSTIPLGTILYIKERECPTFNINWIYLAIIFLLPFILSLVLCILVKKEKGYNPYLSSIYWISGLLFILSGVVITKILKNKIEKWENNEDKDTVNLHSIPFVATLSYILLRITSIWGNKNSGFIKELFILFSTFLGTTIASLSSYTNIYMKYTSGLTKCPT